jgi:hypothetical protein
VRQAEQCDCTFRYAVTCYSPDSFSVDGEVQGFPKVNFCPFCGAPLEEDFMISEPASWCYPRAAVADAVERFDIKNGKSS